MKRNIKKAYEDYLRMNEKGIVNVRQSDIDQIMEMCGADPIRMIGRALQCGVAIGYRIAKNEIRKERG